jgi:hypothetical protein
MSTRSPSAEAGYRAGWAALARHVAHQLREWQVMWRPVSREQDQLRSRVGTLLTQISRLSKRGVTPIRHTKHLCQPAVIVR